LTEQFEEFLDHWGEQLAAPAQVTKEAARLMVKPKKSWSRSWVLPREMPR
jgi:hypothetical protein